MIAILKMEIVAKFGNDAFHLGCDEDVDDDGDGDVDDDGDGDGLLWKETTWEEEAGSPTPQMKPPAQIRSRSKTQITISSITVVATFIIPSPEAFVLHPLLNTLGYHYHAGVMNGSLNLLGSCGLKSLLANLL